MIDDACPGEWLNKVIAKDEGRRCPHCGGVILERRVSAGIYSYGEVAGFAVDGLPLPNLQRLSGMLGAIMERGGAIVSDGDLAELLGSDAVDKGGLIAVRMSALRRDMSLINGGWPFKRRYGKGWYWNGPELAGNDAGHDVPEGDGEAP